MKNIQKCPIVKAHRVTINNSWTVTLELEKIVGFIVARGLIDGRVLPIKSTWDKSWGCPLLSSTMLCWRFLEIMFDLKTERRRNLEEDKFCWIFLLWNSFIEKYQKAYNPNVNIIIDEQLLPCRVRCKFIQYMPNKPDKFGIKIWMAVDVENKHLYNGFLCLGQDMTRSGDANLPMDVVMKLMSLLFR